MKDLHIFNYSSMDFSTFFSKNNFRTSCFDLLALIMTGSKKETDIIRLHETAISKKRNVFALVSL